VRCPLSGVRRCAPVPEHSDRLCLIGNRSGTFTRRRVSASYPDRMYDQNLSKPPLRLKGRRSQRIDLSVSVVVHRPKSEGPQFNESTRTLVVSAHGALVALKGVVAPRQRLLLQNTSSGEQQECRVVSVNKDLTGPPTVAVEFAKPAPSFWRIAFPPADWTTSG
jgi:hypothetical protein